MIQPSGQFSPKAPAAPISAPGVTITGNTGIGKDEQTTVNAVVENPGSTLVLQWQDSTATHGWRNINGETTENYVYTNRETSFLRCRLTSNTECSGSNEFFSNVLLFEVEQPATSGLNIVMYPNPTTGTVIIDSLDTRWSNTVIEIYSAGSTPVIRHAVAPGLRTVTINASSLVPGQYYIRVVADGVLQRKLRFIKI